jgi:hypothetical protein
MTFLLLAAALLAQQASVAVAPREYRVDFGEGLTTMPQMSGRVPRAWSPLNGLNLGNGAPAGSTADRNGPCYYGLLRLAATGGAVMTYPHHERSLLRR